MKVCADVWDRVPDAIEPIVGYRLWSLDTTTPGAPRLVSLNGLVWQRGGWMRAECRPPGPPQGAASFSVGALEETHLAPAESCRCGVYALKERPSRVAMSFGSSHRLILGRVKLAGKVIEHDLGYRAELARVEEFLPVKGQETVAGALGVEYGAQVSAELLSEDLPVPSSSPTHSIPSAARLGVAKSRGTQHRGRRLRALCFLGLFLVGALVDTVVAGPRDLGRIGVVLILLGWNLSVSWSATVG